MWLLPISVLLFSVAVAFPLGWYLAWIMDGHYRAPQALTWCERRVNSGPQTWKQYAVALLVFNTVLYVFGYLVLSLQPWMPLNPRGLGALAPSTIFNTVISFSTNTDIQHYSGDAAFSNFSQLFFCLPMFFLSASIGFCALTAIIRAFRSDPDVGNFFLDMWRVVMYTFLPAVFVLSIVFLIQGMPMTFQSDTQVSTLEPAAMGTADSGQVEEADHRGRPACCICADEDVGHERRGLLWNEFGTSVREPRCRFELPDHLIDDVVPDGVGVHVWPHAEETSAFRNHIFGDVRPPCRDHPMDNLFRHPQAESWPGRTST